MSLQLSQILTPRTQTQMLSKLVQSLLGIGFVRQAGVGPGTVTATGAASGNFAVIVEITTSGDIGAGYYKVSTDGGSTWSSPALIPSVATSVGTTGAVITFANGPTGTGTSFVDGDTYSFSVNTPIFNATAWQQYSVPRRFLDLQSESAADFDALLSKIASSGFLSTAAGAWLDLCGVENYDEDRRAAEFAIGRVKLTDTGGGGPHTLSAGAVWVSNSDGSRRFVNTEGGTLDLLGNLSLDFKAESPGVAWNLSNGAIDTLVTSIPGVTVTNVSRIGAITKSRSGSPNVTASGTPVGDYDIVVQITTGGALGAAIFKYSLDGGLTWAVTGITVPGGGSYALGATGITIVFASGTYNIADQFSFSVSVSWLSQAGLDIESDADYRHRCQLKWSSMAIGRTNATYEFWALEASTQVTRVYSRASSTVAGRVEVYLAGPAGTVSAGVISDVDDYIQPRVPLTCTCVVDTASALNISLTGTVYVTSGLLATAKAAAEAALDEFIQGLPIGGVVVGASRKVPVEKLMGCITLGTPNHPVIGVLDLNLTSPSGDVTITATQVATLTVSGLTWTEV